MVITLYGGDLDEKNFSDTFVISSNLSNKFSGHVLYQG